MLRCLGEADRHAGVRLVQVRGRCIISFLGYTHVTVVLRRVRQPGSLIIRNVNSEYYPHLSVGSSHFLLVLLRSARRLRYARQSQSSSPGR